MFFLMITQHTKKRYKKTENFIVFEILNIKNANITYEKQK